MVNIYIIVATILVFFTGLIWVKTDIANILIKLSFFIVAGWGGYIIYTERVLG